MTREILIDCYRAALDAVDARRSVRDSLVRRPLAGEWRVVAIGKAAGAMAQGAVDALADRVVGGRIVVPPGHLPAGFVPATHGCEVLYSAHPVPDERSLAAGESVVEYVRSLSPRVQLLFLVSGGASSLVECLRPGLTLEDLREVNAWAMTAGVPIGQINAVRRQLSQIKGGGLARLAVPRTRLALMISDVPRDDPRVIGSGLLHAPAASEVALAWPRALAGMRTRLGSGAHAGPTPRVPVRLVATLRLACEAAATAARRHGFDVTVARRRLAGDAAALGRGCAARLARLPATALHVWGGETTVTLPPHPGRGGRNQHLALAAAIELEARATTAACLLAAGTDGIDGASPDAGAVVDASTCVRGRDAGFDPCVSLEHADSGSFLEAAGDLLHTGATLTNVGDLVLGIGSKGRTVSCAP